MSSLDPAITEDLQSSCKQIVKSSTAQSAVALRYYLIPGACSCVALLMAGSFLLLHKKLAGHPYRLLGWTCLAESITYNYYISLSWKCGFL